MFRQLFDDTFFKQVCPGASDLGNSHLTEYDMRAESPEEPSLPLTTDIESWAEVLAVVHSQACDEHRKFDKTWSAMLF